MADIVVEELILKASFDNKELLKGAEQLKEAWKQVETSLRQATSGITNNTKGMGNAFVKAANDSNKSVIKFNRSVDKLHKKSRQAKQSIQDVEKATEKAGKNTKKSGKEAGSFFTSMTKNLFIFVASLFSLKGAINQVVDSAAKFGSASAGARASGLSPAMVAARRYTEKQYNIPEGTFEKSIANVQSVQGNYIMGNRPNIDLLKAMKQAGLNVTDLQKMDPAVFVQKMIQGTRKYSLAERRTYLDQIGAGEYANLTNSEYNSMYKDLFRNQKEQESRKDVYEEGEAERKEYVKAQQELANAMLEFGRVGLPALTGAIGLFAAAVEVFAHPIDKLEEGFSKAYEGFKILLSGKIAPDHVIKKSDEIADLQTRFKAQRFGVNLEDIPENATYNQVRKMANESYNKLHAPKKLSTPQTLPQSMPSSKSVTFNQTNHVTSSNPESTVKNLAFNSMDNSRLESVLT